MEILFVYFWLKLDIILFCSFSGLGLSVGCGLVGFFNIWDATDNLNRSIPIAPLTSVVRINFWRKLGKRCFKAGLIFLLVCIIVPSSKDVAALVGTHYALKLTGSPEGTKVMQLIRKQANGFLDELLKGK